MFKRAYARGVNDELIRLGAIRYPSKTAADEVADAVGDHMPVEPAAEDVPAEVAGEIAATLVDAANQLVSSAGASAGVPEGQELPPEMAQGMEEAAKQSAAADIDTRAHAAATDLMQKAAEHTKRALGSTIEGGDKGNTMMEAPAAETKMENSNRPVNKYVAGVGNTAYPVGKGNVGTEQSPAPEAPGESPSGTNSVIRQSKMGSVLAGVLRKYAMGSTIEGGDKGNTPAEAASVTGEAALDNTLRPQGKYVVGVGNTEMAPGTGVVGSEQPHELAPGASAPGSNSVTEFSASNKSGSYDPFLALFEVTAQKVAAHLPNNLSQDEKVAHIRQMMGYTDEEIVSHIGLLHKQAGATDDQAVAAATAQAKAASAQRPRYAGPGSTRTDHRLTNQKTATAEETTKSEEKPNHGDKGTFPMNLAKKDEKTETKAEEKAEKEGSASGNLLARIRSVSQTHLRA
jgi:hypothetical protein